jgi:hypothetical protein
MTAAWSPVTSGFGSRGKTRCPLVIAIAVDNVSWLVDRLVNPLLLLCLLVDFLGGGILPTKIRAALACQKCNEHQSENVMTSFHGDRGSPTETGVDSPGALLRSLFIAPAVVFPVPHVLATG